MPGPKGRDLEATRSQLEGWLAAHMEGAGDVSVSGLRGPSDTGFSSDTLLFDVGFRCGAETRVESLVARIEPRGFNVFPSYDVGVQFRVMQALGATDVPVPRVRWLEEDERVLGAPFFVMDRVVGQVPNDSPPYAVGGWVFELAPEERARLWWSGLEAMARVHQLDWRRLGLAFLPGGPNGGGPNGGGPRGSAPDEGPLRQQLREVEAYFRWGVEDTGRYPLIRRALDWLHAHAPDDEAVGLCWGDSRLANQIFRDLECVAVIDWEMVRLGNPVQDLAWWVSLDRSFSEGLGLPRLAGLPGVPETVSRWASLTGLDTRHFDYYRVLALLKFSAIMARIGLQMKHYGQMPGEAVFDVDNLASITLASVLREVAGSAAATPA